MDIFHGRHRTGSHCRWMKTITVGVMLAMCSLTLVPAGWPQGTEGAQKQDREQGTASGAGLQVASLLVTIPYFAVKGAFAIIGAIGGGITYALSGGNSEAAKAVWTTTMYGTYIITPDHLTGDKPVRFLGVSEESKGPEPTPAAPAQ